MTEEQLRRCWRIASWEMFRRGDFRSAREALANGFAIVPPTEWKTGVKLARMRYDDAGWR